jgi:hypothetical protein
MSWPRWATYRSLSRARLRFRSESAKVTHQRAHLRSRRNYLPQKALGRLLARSVSRSGRSLELLLLPFRFTTRIQIRSPSPPSRTPTQDRNRRTSSQVLLAPSSRSNNNNRSSNTSRFPFTAKTSADCRCMGRLSSHRLHSNPQANRNTSIGTGVAMCRGLAVGQSMLV